jgi:hypothetical protein
MDKVRERIGEILTNVHQEGYDGYPLCESLDNARKALADYLCEVVEGEKLDIKKYPNTITSLVITKISAFNQAISTIKGKIRKIFNG